MKLKACSQIGIDYQGFYLPETVSQQEIIEKIKQLDQDNRVSGILVQLHLPPHINEQVTLSYISPEKDVDGLNPKNVGNLALKKYVPQFTSCTPLGVLKLIQSVCPSIEGKRVTVCGRSNIVGMPLALLLNKHNATVSLCHSQTRDIEAYVRQADIVITAIGVPEYFKGKWFKPGAIAIDVGINSREDGSIIGDIQFSEAIKRCSKITPVPGGVGPMTITMLMSNLVDSWQKMNF